MSIKRFKCSCWALAGLIFVLAIAFSLVFSQQEEMGAFRGRVTDKNGNPLADVNITLYDTQRGTRIELKTDKNGNFFRRGLYVSVYEVHYELEGYRPVKEQINIVSRRTPHHKITLEQSDPKGVVVEDFNKASKLFQEGKYQESIKLFEEIIEKIPDYAEAHYNLALCYVRINDFDNAIPHLEKAVELKPDMITAYDILGEAYRNKKEFNKMVDIFNKAVELDPNNPDYYTNLGIAYCSLRKNDEAVDVLNKAVQLDDSLSLAYYLLGVAYNAKGDAENSIKSFEKFIELEPNAPQIPMIQKHIEKLKEELSKKKPQN